MKRKRIITLSISIIAVLLMLVCHSGISEASQILLFDFSSDATTLDFEELSGGIDVANQYVSQGVLWYGRDPVSDDGDPVLPFSGNVALTNTNYHNVSCSDSLNPNTCSAQIGDFRVVATTLTFPTYGTNSGIIGAAFVDPLTGNLATTLSAGAFMFNHQSYSQAFSQMDVFGVNGQLLETLQIAGQGGENLFFGITRPEGIHRVEFFTGYLGNIRGPDGFNIDDFIFEPLADSGIAGSVANAADPIPEPATFSLLGLGLAGLVLKKKKHS